MPAGGADWRRLVAATVDVWRNASNRLYAVQDPMQHPNNLRGRFLTRDDGAFEFLTIRWVPYPITDDGRSEPRSPQQALTTSPPSSAQRPLKASLDDLLCARGLVREAQAAGPVLTEDSTRSIVVSFQAIVPSTSRPSVGTV